MRREYPSAPIVGVGAVIFKEDQVLLIKRRKAPLKGAWSLPGGAQNLGETYKEAAVREVSEETSIIIEVLQIIDVVDSIFKDDRERIQYHYTLIDVLGLWVGGTPIAQDDAMEAKWFDLDEIKGLGLWSETIKIIEKGHKIKNNHLLTVNS